jgi:3,4-dihydroxy 2-butanone 4-phosphate synthase/GTP cyclohydrolase II
VICEIINDDGTMARVGDLAAYQKRHGLKACTIAQLIEYRRRSEKLVVREETIKMPTDFGEFDCHLYRINTDGSHHLALSRGPIDPEKPTLVRVHSECLTGDVFHSQRCDCGGQLAAALEHISKEGGVLLYLRQEGRGIGLPAKIHAYKLQILCDLGVRRIRLLTNNPKKVIGLDGYGLEITEQLPIALPANPHNEKYLETKRTRMGHRL